MVRTCAVYNCKTNVKSRKLPAKPATATYKLPKDPVERQRWLAAIPKSKEREWTSNSAICRLHWPVKVTTVSIYGKDRPANPPSIWPGVPLSLIPEAPPPLRITKNSLDERKALPDEMSNFNSYDKTSYQDLKKELMENCTRKFAAPVVTFKGIDDHIVIQSKEFTEGIPRFVIKVYQN